MTFSLPPSRHAAAGARRALAGLRPHVGKELLEDLRLLVTELVTNSVRHSGAEGAQPVHVGVSAGPDHVRVEVRDSGAGFDAKRPSRRAGGRARPSAEATGGWGLYLVDRLADRWGVVQDEGTCVWLEIDR